MYETLIMLKPEAAFTFDDLHALACGVAKGGRAAVAQVGTRLRVGASDASLNIDWNDAPHVLEESNEIAECYGVPSQGCRARLEMFGDDPEMELFNDYLIINERLQATGQFVIFDPQQGKLLFA